MEDSVSPPYSYSDIDASYVVASDLVQTPIKRMCRLDVRVGLSFGDEEGLVEKSIMLSAANKSNHYRR